MLSSLRTMYVAAAQLLSICLMYLCSEGPQVLSIPVQNEYFTVAVLEHARVGDQATETPQQIIRANLGYYERAAALAKSKNADIVVFPEYGLFPLFSRREMKHYLETVPDPKAGTWNPCLQRTLFADRPMLRNLSCMAMEHEIVVVANTGDIQPCNSEESTYCPQDRTFHYNANTVFDRQGTIISRYRKEHLYIEIGMDLPPKPQDPSFTTDFGKFANFICFDSIFKHMVDAAHTEGVDGVILPVMWVDYLPFYHAVQYFQGWAINNNVTLIQSNLQLPAFGAVGSGVYAGRAGALAYTFNPDGHSKLIVSKAPKTKHRNPLHNAESSITIITANGTKPYNEDDVDFDTYLPEYCTAYGQVGQDGRRSYGCVYERTDNYTFVKLAKLRGSLAACHNGLCCSLKYSSLAMNESFFLGVTNSTHNSDNRYFYTQEKCMVVRCEAFEGKKCSVFPTKSSTVFLELELTANFSTPYIYPSVMRSGMRTAPVSEWNYDIIQESDHYKGSISFTNSLTTNKLVVASLSGRCYDRDPPYVHTGY